MNSYAPCPDTVPSGNFVPWFRFSLRDDLATLCDRLGADLKPSDFLPTQIDPTASGYDVRCAAPEGVTLRAIDEGNYVKIPLGIRMFAPPGWWLQLAPRSSTFTKLNINPLYGIIDETFENELVFVGQYLPNVLNFGDPRNEGRSTKVINFGDRIAQLLPVQRQIMQVSQVSTQEFQHLSSQRQGQRGTGGFGSSGTR